MVRCAKYRSSVATLYSFYTHNLHNSTLILGSDRRVSMFENPNFMHVKNFEKVNFMNLKRGTDFYHNIVPHSVKYFKVSLENDLNDSNKVKGLSLLSS
jgi:hypothetical protein